MRSLPIAKDYKGLNHVPAASVICCVESVIRRYEEWRRDRDCLFKNSSMLSINSLLELAPILNELFAA